MAGTRYLHFACHGEFEPEQPLHSGLVLSDGEVLSLRQVLDEIPLESARLAILSACQTAITDYNNLPDEFIGLPAGFLQAGVAGVLGSLWPVDDLSTAIFMDHFYRLHREGGQEPAAALQATQRWLRCLTVAELKILFAQYKANAPDGPTAGRMAYALAQDQYAEFTLNSNLPAMPYAEPYHWAAFAFYGV
jgi:CHAT domain-containing protein